MGDTPICDEWAFTTDAGDEVVPLIIAQSLERQKEDWRREALSHEREKKETPSKTTGRCERMQSV